MASDYAQASADIKYKMGYIRVTVQSSYYYIYPLTCCQLGVEIPPTSLEWRSPFRRQLMLLPLDKHGDISPVMRIISVYHFPFQFNGG